MAAQLSRRCKYALRALYRLGRHYTASPLAVCEIAATEKIPRKFLETILVQLRNAGIVESQLGKHGGYRLARSPDQITVGDIIRAVDDSLAPLPCVAGRSARLCAECAHQPFCQTQWIMRQVGDAIAGVLDQTTLAEACRPRDEREALTFQI